MAVFDTDLTPLIPPERTYVPDPDVVAVRRSSDGAIVQEIFIRRNGTFGFRYTAWVNFEDAGGDAHHGWGTLHPEAELLTDSVQEALALALLHAQNHEVALPVEAERCMAEPALAADARKDARG